MDISTSNSDDGPVLVNVNGFAYGIGALVVVTVLTIAATLLSYLCTRNRLSSSNSNQSFSSSVVDNGSNGHIIGNGLVTLQTMRIIDSTVNNVRHQGIDDATLVNFPKLFFSEAKLHRKDTTALSSSCSICLGDYKETEMLRLLPECGHFFHLKCVDPWLMLKLTCPLCRATPVFTPLATPLAEVAPLAAVQIV